MKNINKNIETAYKMYLNDEINEYQFYQIVESYQKLEEIKE